MKSKSEAATKIEIPAIEIAKAIIPLVGRTPLVQNGMSQQVRDGLEAGALGGPKKKKKVRNPEEEWRGALHLLPDGRCGLAGSGIMKALVAAGGRFTNQKMTQIRGLISIPEELVAINGTPEMRKDFACPKMGSGAIVLYRPMFRQWSMDVPVVYLSNLIGLPEIVNLFQMAGFCIGLGTWRKENDGTFGAFEVREGRHDQQ